MVLSPGDKVDRFTLIRPLGEGGQGSVWEANDPIEGKKRALKLAAGVDEGSLRRMRREAKTLAAIRHPSLVRCYGLFEDLERGVIGLVLDLVEGRTLASLMDDPAFSDHHRRTALSILAGAIAHVHGLGLVHRDIKLDNVIVTDDFLKDPSSVLHLKLVDFGIAASSGNPGGLTVTGKVMGTLAYLAPETIDPTSFGRSDEGPARDLFAFGVLGYLLFFPRKHPTGLSLREEIVDYARAYKAASSGVIPWPPPALRERPGGLLAEALSACLALRAADRPASGDALDQILRGKGEITAPHPAPSRTDTAPSFAPKGGTEPMNVGWKPPIIPTPQAAPAKRSSAKAPPRSSGSSPRAAGKRQTSLLRVTLTLFGLAAAGTGTFLAWEHLRPPEVASPLPLPEQPQPMMLPTSPPTLPGRVNVDVCCFGESATCESGRACVQCVSRPSLPNRAWSLRLAKVGEFLADGANKVDRTRDPAYAAVSACVQHSRGERRCVPMSDLASRGPKRLELLATTEDLRTGNLTVTLYNDTTQETLERDSPRFDKPILTSALCAGLVLRFSKQPNGNQRFITLYLDDE